MFRPDASKLILTTWFILLSSLLSSCEVHLGPLPGARSASASDSTGDSGEPAGEVWVYTSIYQSVIEQLDPIIVRKYPALKVNWYRAGSEKVATRLDTELRAGGSLADLVMTSDPFWYLKLKQEGLLLPYVTADLLPIPRSFMDLDGQYATCRVSTMVIAYNPDIIPMDQLPSSFSDLTQPRFNGMVALGDPLASGTHFTTSAFLSKVYGWEFYKTLRAGGAVASGGNSSVMRRIEGKENPLGVVLLENVLANRAKGSPIDYILPRDGVITIPGNIAILKSTQNPSGAKAIFDLIMSPEGQRAMVEGNMHSANPRIAPPSNTPAFNKLPVGKFAWSESFTADIKNRAAEIKSTFDAVMNK